MRCAERRGIVIRIDWGGNGEQKSVRYDYDPNEEIPCQCITSDFFRGTGSRCER